VALIINGGKLTGRVLAKAMEKFLALAKKASEVKQDKAPADYKHHGKQTVREIVGQGDGVTSIEISDKNIKSFEGIARKYGVDFAVTKDKSTTPPKHIVFFKGRDTDAITQAFKEYTHKQLHQARKPRIADVLKQMHEKVKNQVLDTVKNKDRGGIEL
jgi:hypothetical protein